MINLKQELQNYPPIDLNSIVGNREDIPDNIKNSIILYNKALDNLRMDSEDIAIIELKKAVAMNPHFHEAMNLLGICYDYIKDYSKAIEMFEKVMAAENNSIKALSYLNMMGANDSAVSLPEIRKKPHKSRPVSSEGSEPPIGKLRRRNPNRLILGYVIVFAVGIILSLVLGRFIYGTKSEEVSAEPLKQESTVEETTTDESAEDTVGTLQEQIKNLDNQLDYNKNVMKLYQINELASAKKYEAAADMLVLLKNFEFQDADRAKYDELYNNIVTKAATTAYYEGAAFYNSKKYQEALNKYKKVLSYGNDWKFMDALLYMTGRCYLELKDSRNALDAYKKVVDNFPKSQYARWANNAIKGISGQP